MWIEVNVSRPYTKRGCLSNNYIYLYGFMNILYVGNAMRAFPDISRICRGIIYIQVEPSSRELLAREITLYQNQ